VSVIDTEGRPLVDASVGVFNLPQTGIVGTARTGPNGLATIGSAPAAVRVHVDHDFGVHYLNTHVDVAQEGATFLEVAMRPNRPRPTAALLPVSIPTGSVSGDRSELSLSVTVVASPSSPFAPAADGDYSPKSTPAVGLAIGPSDDDYDRQCHVWLDGKRISPSCGTPWGESPYTVSVNRFNYDAVGTVPLSGAPEPARTAMLIMDQSRRVAALDPGAQRSFAARRFLERAASSYQAEGLSVVGFAGDGDGGSALLPTQPLWLPLGAGSVYSTDPSLVVSAVGMLEPFVGGGAPVFDALQAAFTLVADHAPPRGRAVVALLGGGDDRDMSEAALRQALAALRQRSVDADIHSVLIIGASQSQRADRVAIAELAAALNAPTVSLGAADVDKQTWTAGSYAALDLAADLLDAVPLPTVSAVFRVKANEPGTFPAGAMLRGVVWVESIVCPLSCWEFPLDFVVEIP
jgi:hypothetical protein